MLFSCTNPPITEIICLLISVCCAMIYSKHFSKFLGDNTTNFRIRVPARPMEAPGSTIKVAFLFLEIADMWVGINPWSHQGSKWYASCIHNAVAYRSVDAGSVLLTTDPSPGNFREHLIPDCDWWGTEVAGSFTLTKLWSKVIEATGNAGTYFLWSSMLCICKDRTRNRKRRWNISNIWFVDESYSSENSWKQA